MRETAEQLAQNYLSRAARSEHELRCFLEEKNIPEKLCASILQLARTRHWVDDADLAMTLTQKWMKKGYGPLVIDEKLRGRGLRHETIAQTFALMNWQQHFEETFKRLSQQYSPMQALSRMMRQGFPEEFLEDYPSTMD